MIITLTPGHDYFSSHLHQAGRRHSDYCCEQKLAATESSNGDPRPDTHLWAVLVQRFEGLVSKHTVSLASQGRAVHRYQNYDNTLHHALRSA